MDAGPSVRLQGGRETINNYKEGDTLDQRRENSSPSFRSRTSLSNSTANLTSTPQILFRTFRTFKLVLIFIRHACPPFQQTPPSEQPLYYDLRIHPLPWYTSRKPGCSPSCLKCHPLSRLHQHQHLYQCLGRQALALQSTRSCERQHGGIHYNRHRWGSLGGKFNSAVWKQHITNFPWHDIHGFVREIYPELGL